MNKSLFAILVVSMAAKAPAAPTASASHYSRKDLKTLSTTASTGAELERLAMYYQTKAGAFREQALQKKAAWKSALEHPLPTSKFPTVSDRARGLYSYYTAKAEEATEKAKAFRLRLQKLDQESQTSGTQSH